MAGLRIIAGMQTQPTRRARKVLAGVVVAGAVALPGVASAAEHFPRGPGGNGPPSICVPVPGSGVTTPAGGPGYGFLGGPPAADQAYDNCPPPQ